MELVFDPDDDVVDAVYRAWGPPDANHEWVDEPDRVVAQLDDEHGHAALSWAAFQTVDDLIAPQDPDRFGFETSFYLMGASADRARELAHAGDLVSDRSLTVSLHPLTAGSIVVELEITFERGEVVAYSIHIEKPDANDAVLAALTRKLGPPAIDGAGARDWIHRGNRIHAVAQRDGLVIDVAQLPQ